MRTIYILAAASVLAGCASRSGDIAEAYVSPLQYQGLSCAQLSQEAARVSARAAIASGAQDQNATNDTIATTAAVILFLPAAFLIKGNGANARKSRSLRATWTRSNKQTFKRNVASNLIKAPPPRAETGRFTLSLMIFAERGGGDELSTRVYSFVARVRFNLDRLVGSHSVPVCAGVCVLLPRL
jgi:hypothetical protein